MSSGFLSLIGLRQKFRIIHQFKETFIKKPEKPIENIKKPPENGRPFIKNFLPFLFKGIDTGDIHTRNEQMDIVGTFVGYYRF